MSENIAVDNLLEYLKIKTVHPDPDYGNFIGLKSLKGL